MFIHAPISVPYDSSGQELGETRSAMAKRLMMDLEETINTHKKLDYKYYVLVNAKPFPGMRKAIKIKILAPIPIKPSMMLSCMLFGVDNKSGKLTLEWSLPGDWPTWAVGGANEPIPEVIASINESGVKYRYDSILSV